MNNFYVKNKFRNFLVSCSIRMLVSENEQEVDYYLSNGIKFLQILARIRKQEIKTQSMCKE